MDHPSRRRFLGSTAGLGFAMGFAKVSSAQNSEDLALYAGEGVGSVRDIPSAGDLVARLWKECVAAG
jgi:hypothetical protein